MPVSSCSLVDLLSTERADRQGDLDEQTSQGELIFKVFQDGTKPSVP